MTKRKITALALIILGLAVLMSGDLTPRSLGAPGWSPVGKVESIDDEGFVKGYVFDNANQSATVSVNIYIDGQAQSNLFAVVQANQQRPDLAAPGSAHGFSIQVPTRYMVDGTQHTIYASAVQPGTGEQALLLDAHGNQFFKFPFIDLNANGMGSSDVGVNINAANDYLSYSGRRGIIHVYSGGTISTQAVISPRNTLRLHDGVYQPTLNGPAILLKDHTAVIGDGWNTIVKENSIPQYTYTRASDGEVVVIKNKVVISSDGAWPAPLAERNYDITVKDFKVEGHSAQEPGSDNGPIVLGNVRRAIVSRIWFDSTHAFGVVVGGPARRWYYDLASTKYYQTCPGCAVTTEDNEAADLDLFANNVWIINNKFTHVVAQNASTVNAQFVTVSGNFFEKPGQLVGGPTSSLIDIEPNTWHDSAEYTIVEDNHAETAEAFQSGHGSFIVYQPADFHRGGPALIRNNQLNSATQVTNMTSNGVIMKPQAIDVLIYGNSFYGTGLNGLHLNGTRIYAYNNLLDSCGTTGAPAITLGSVTPPGAPPEFLYDSMIFNNTWQNTMGGPSPNAIDEVAPSDRNIVTNNPGFATFQPRANSTSPPNNPTVPLIYPSIPTPTFTNLGDGRIAIAAPISVFISIRFADLEPDCQTHWGGCGPNSPLAVYGNAPLAVPVEIHYTLDGTEPTLFSPRYYGPLKVTGTVTIKAKGFYGGLLGSSIQTYSQT